jgi:formylglycine-generating enzyme required for sulfatase activity
MGRDLTFSIRSSSILVSAIVASVGLYAPAAGQAACDVCPGVVTAPSGRFLMGSPPDELERESWDVGSESPRHEVLVPRPFGIGRHQVTRGEFAQYVRATRYPTDGGCHVFDGIDWRLDPTASWRSPGFDQADDHPVVCVSWLDAMAYVGWLNLRGGDGTARWRLPTEAEREYAARAGTSTPFWWGAMITPADANYDTRDVYPAGMQPAEPQRAPYRGATVPASAFAANAWGLHNVHGNVWEWTADCHVPTYADKPAELSADASRPRIDRGCDRRALRGGAFNRHPKTLRAAYRTGLDPKFRGHSIGLRVVRDLR